jgi:hypothetical protein
MTELVRIVYISRASFQPVAAEDGVDATIARILSVSRRNNQRNGVVGMLHYGDGCFFQCLEGERGKITSLYRRLRRDERHKDLKILVQEPIRRLSFPDWSMKFVPVDTHVEHLLEQHGFNAFDPYRFDHHLVERMLSLMQGSADPTQHDPVVAPSAPARSTMIEHAPQTQSGGAAPAGRGPLIVSLLALVISVLSLLISINGRGL